MVHTAQVITLNALEQADDDSSSKIEQVFIRSFEIYKGVGKIGGFIQLLKYILILLTRS